MRLVLALILICFSGVSVALQQSPNNSENAESSHYISDDLYIFVHAGPGRNYRILGSIEAGMPVVKTEKDITNDFVEIIDKNGRQGWIEAEFLSAQPSRRFLVDTLKEQSADAESRLAPLRRELSAEKRKYSELVQSNNALTSERDALLNQVTKLQQNLDERGHEQQLRTMLFGGGLVGGGALLGVIFVYLPKKRKRSSGWID